MADRGQITIQYVAVMVGKCLHDNPTIPAKKILTWRNKPPQNPSAIIIHTIKIMPLELQLNISSIVIINNFDNKEMCKNLKHE